MVGALCVLLAAQAFAAEEEDLGALSLEELLDVELTVASRAGRTLRDSPAVVTLVTRDEIQALGARDLMDALHRVPGVAFGVDVSGVVGIGFRGLWGHEGKVLLLVDGQEMNENLYSTTQFGHHIPAEHIEKIEIIRGPGSAIYGGSAELAVINVVTRRGAALSGGEASLAYGATRSTFARQVASAAYGRKLENGLEFSLSAQGNLGRRADATTTDFYGDMYDLGEDSRIDTAFVNAALSWHGASVRFIWDDYRMELRDSYDAHFPTVYHQAFRAILGELRYDAKVGESLTITPKVNWRRQSPWHTPEKSSDAPFYDKSVERNQAGISAAWDARESVNLQGGVEGYQDRAYLNDEELVGFQTQFQNGRSSVSYTNAAAWAQALVDTPVVNIALGARFEEHSQFGESVVPRVALTRVFDKLHVKLLASSAFRAPGVENIRLNEDIEPERTRVFEAETGYQVSPQLFVTANVFDIMIEDPIVYFYDIDTDEEGYVNYPQTGSRGVEAELRVQEGRTRARLGVSIYDSVGRNQVPNYAVPENRGALMGLPQLKVVANLNVPATADGSVDMTATLLGPRYGYLEGDGAGNAEITESPSVMLVDVVFWQRNALLPRLDLGLGVYNLTNADFRVIQPYDGYHAPLPIQSREAMLRVAYSF